MLNKLIINFDFNSITLKILELVFIFFNSILIQPPTPLKNASLIYNELGLSNITVGGSGDGDGKSKNVEEKRLLRHVDSVIETILDETRLSEGEGEISKLLRGSSQPTTGMYKFIIYKSIIYI